MLQGNEVFAGLEAVEHLLLFLDLFVRIARGFDRQTDAAISAVNLDHARGHFLVGLEHVLDFIHVIFGDLGNVHQPINVVLQANERAEAGEFRDFAGDEVADFVMFVDVVPRIGAELFNAARNALVGFVDFENKGFGFVAFLEDFRWMIDFARPRNIPVGRNAVNLARFATRPKIAF